jgi:uncharacterized protein (TIGR02596 family)
LFSFLRPMLARPTGASVDSPPATQGHRGGGECEMKGRLDHRAHCDPIRRGLSLIAPRDLVSRERQSRASHGYRKRNSGLLRSRSSKFPSSTKASAFTLMELMVVVGIIMLLATLMAPMLSTALRGTNLTQATDKVIGVLGQARQTAIAKGQTVEVRFYCYKDPEIPGDTGQCHALQALSISDMNATSPITKPILLPQTVIISTNASLSSLLDTNATNANFVASPSGVGIRGVTNISYSWIRFTRSGSTSLAGLKSADSSGSWFLTLENLADDKPGATAPPPNFATIAIDNLNGAIKVYRPTQ